MSGFETIELHGSAYQLEIYSDFRRFVATAPSGTLESIVAAVFPASMSAFGQPDSPEFYADVFEHVRDSDALVVCKQGAQAVGFASFKDIASLDTLFLNGIALEAVHHGNGIARDIVEAMLQRVPRGRLAFTTQNPRMYELACNLGKSVFPRAGMSIPETEYAYCQQLLKGRQGVHELSTCVIHGLYDSCMYPHLPISSDAEKDAWFCETLSADSERRTRDGALIISILN